MDKLQHQVHQWAFERSIIEGSTLADQAAKMLSEYGELCDAVAKGDNHKITDSIGDIAVCLTVLEGVYYQGQGTPVEFTKPKNNAADLAEFVERNLNDGGNAKYAMLSQLGYPLLALFRMCSFNGKPNADSFQSTLVSAWSELQAISNHLGHPLYVCLSIAYEEIKDHKGQLVNGVFIKEV